MLTLNSLQMPFSCFAKIINFASVCRIICREKMSKPFSCGFIETVYIAQRKNSEKEVRGNRKSVQFSPKLRPCNPILPKAGIRVDASAKVNNNFTIIAVYERTITPFLGDGTCWKNSSAAVIRTYFLSPLGLLVTFLVLPEKVFSRAGRARQKLKMDYAVNIQY